MAFSKDDIVSVPHGNSRIFGKVIEVASGSSRPLYLVKFFNAMTKPLWYYERDIKLVNNDKFMMLYAVKTPGKGTTYHQVGDVTKEGLKKYNLDYDIYYCFKAEKDSE